MIEIKIKCDTCSEELCADFDERGTLCVEPCEECLEDARNEGYEKGLEDVENNKS